MVLMFTDAGMSSDTGVSIVTGGAGFLGSHLVDRLIDEGRTVICVDNLQTGLGRNVAHLEGNDRFRFVHGDIAETFEIGPADEVFNFACPASPPAYQADPVRTMRTNVVGMLNVLEWARRHGARVFQASTSEVYGDPLVHPQGESYLGNVNPAGPRACYDEGKRAAEALCFDFRRMFGVDVRVARIFNTYGPRMDPNDGRVVSNFICQALRGEPITIYGEGSQTRSFCYCDDLVDGIMRLMRRKEPFTGPVNLGNPGEITVAALADMAIAMTGSKSAMTFAGLPVDDPVRRCPDIAVAERALGWRPRTDLRQGLERTIAYFSGILAKA
jgi:UDP-glucuronate decarboxylase